MIWSFVNADERDSYYYETAYGSLGYFRRDSGAWFARQPAENHVEYNFVNMMYQHWKASGDNTGYYEACNQLSEMLEYAGMKEKAAMYRQRGKDILARLNSLSWNGRYYTHFIDEDPSVINEKPASFTISKMEKSTYADFELSLPAIQNIHIQYN
jgi:hypothetical protein